MASPSQLNVIALISGGKDSLYSILHCLVNGHKIVALANLFPPTNDDKYADRLGAMAFDIVNEDIDSYMYQTVGHAVIPLYEEALGIPLYRQQILGSAVNQDKSYTPFTSTDGIINDETESLVPLFQKVKQAHPDANAVSTGAILSNYQRTRIESVAIRMGLVPLSYLWQFPYLPPGLQRSLLDDMALAGQDVRIIKVASGGLDESFLWENLATERVKKRLANVMGRFGGLDGGALLGEGGEFETLAIDGPQPLWKKKIIIAEDDKEIIETGGGSVLLKIKKGSLASKTVDTDAAAQTVQPRIPALLDRDFADLVHRLSGPQTSVPGTLAEDVSSQLSSFNIGQVSMSQEIPNVWEYSPGLRAYYLSNIVAPEAGRDAEIQMRAIAFKLPSRLQAHGKTLDDVLFVTILLRSIKNFIGVNRAYCHLFPKPNPPARVTISCGDSLPDGIDILLALVIGYKNVQSPRKGLHVQSRSYWAPSNIGPYSQAISLPTSYDEESRPRSNVYVAGQIPLVPASMQLVRNDQLDNMASFRLQTVLSLQHLWRIGRVMDVRWWTGGIAFIAGNNDIEEKSRIIAKAWEHVHLAKCHISENGSTDSDTDLGISLADCAAPPLDRQEYLCPLPDPSMINAHEDTPLVPPVFAVQIEELPQGASVEWATSLGLSNSIASIHDRTDPTDSISICCFPAKPRNIIVHRGIDDRYSIEALEERVNNAIDKGLQTGIVHRHSTVYTSRPWGTLNGVNRQIIPCKSVWGYSAGHEWGRLAAGVVWRGEITQPLSVQSMLFSRSSGGAQAS